MSQIKHSAKPGEKDQLILILDSKDLKSNFLSKEEIAFVKEAVANKRFLVQFNNEGKLKLVIVSEEQSGWKLSESLRKAGAKSLGILNENGKESVSIITEIAHNALAFAEGMALANYSFTKYKSKPKENSLKTIRIVSKNIDAKSIQNLSIIIESTYLARDLVNEPHSFLTSLQISEEFKKISKKAGFTIEVWNEAKIASQKMGGILAVNKASKIPPTFNILEYKPKNAVNKKPYVLVGKGVVYDTGGLSLKPTPKSMDIMKCDMAGAAVVAGVMNAVAKMELPLYVIGLVPATDNWIGENSYAPGDVITMYDGTTVEVMNTDAEGRLILADTLHYAKKLKPELVCDFATLTGAAVRAIGSYATAVLGNADDTIKTSIFESSYAVFERLVEFPLWEDYAKELKSEIADMTNLGKGEGGQISAAKFLEHFTDYPWMHFDIAGPAFIDSVDSYKTAGGTGVGVRLMVDFLSKQVAKK
ncbi:MAG: leucyl aminopeptidase [Bacteroidia bacterium]|nr:leucyl aminopeptidase [Bacteroidia bacterium]